MKMSDIDAKTKRDYLYSYDKAYRDIELTQVAIDVLEKVTACNSIITALKKKQQAHLRRIDFFAEKLGVPTNR